MCFAAALVGCAKELNPTTVDNASGNPVKFEINVQETKAAKDTWENGDIIYVFFKGLEEKYLVLTYWDGSWDNDPGAGEFVESDFSSLDGESLTLTAVHFPDVVDVKFADGKFSFSQNGNPVYSYYLCQKDAEYTFKKATVSASLHMGKPANISLFRIAGISENVPDHTLACSLVQPLACTAVTVDGEITEELAQPGARVNGVKDNDGVIFSGHLTTTESANYTFVLANNDNIFTLSKERELAHVMRYNMPTPNSGEWSIQNVSDLYVDLGLGVKWATCNLGAATESEGGAYFAWGEVLGELAQNGQLARKYSFKNYYWLADEGRTGTSGDAAYITRYTFADGETTGIWYDGDKFVGDGVNSLQGYNKIDDAAYAALGGKFRMPTYSDWEDLIHNCDWQWVEKQDGYSNPGCRVTSRKQGYTDKSIFLPAMRMYDSKGISYHEDIIGWYWSSTLAGKSQTASVGAFGPETKHSSGIPRACGMPIRPVSD